MSKNKNTTSRAGRNSYQKDTSPGKLSRVQVRSKTVEQWVASNEDSEPRPFTVSLSSVLTQNHRTGELEAPLLASVELKFLTEKEANQFQPGKKYLVLFTPVEDNE